MLCALVTASPKRLPTTSWRSVTGTATISASFAALRKRSTSLPRRKCQQQIPSMTIDPKIRPASIVCRYARSANPLDRSAQTLVSCASPFTILYPTGCCIHEFATRMKYPDIHEPSHGDPQRRQVHARREAVPAEDPEAEERRLEHERGEALDRERRAEDVADELRVDRPVHPELELLHEAGRDADREVDQEERAEEVRQPQPALVPRPVPHRLHDRHERPQPERQRHEEEVVDRRRRELDPREVDRRDCECSVHVRSPVSSPRSFVLAGAATSSRGDDSPRASRPQDAADGTRAPGARRRRGALADGGRDRRRDVLTVLLPDDVRLGPAWAAAADRGRVARRGDRRRPGLDHAPLARAAGALDRARVGARARRAVVDGAADRRPHPRRPGDELGRASCSRPDRSCGCRTTSRSHCSTGSSTAAARLRAPTSRSGSPRPRLPAAAEPEHRARPTGARGSSTTSTSASPTRPPSARPT